MGTSSSSSVQTLLSTAIPTSSSSTFENSFSSLAKPIAVPTDANIPQRSITELSAVNVVNMYPMMKCDAIEVALAFQNYHELYLDRDGSWVNNGTNKAERKLATNGKSNYKKVMLYCMTLLSEEEKAIAKSNQPTDRIQRGVWLEALLKLCKVVHFKIMNSLSEREAEIRVKNNEPAATKIKKNKKAPVLSSTLTSLAKRLGEIEKNERILNDKGSNQVVAMYTMTF